MGKFNSSRYAKTQKRKLRGTQEISGRVATNLFLAGSPPYSALLEPERELHERTRDFRERLKKLCKSQVRSTSPLPFPTMGGADPPARRTVHQRASEGVTGARSSITRPAIPNTNTWQIPSHVMSTITHATQFHGLEDEDAPGHLSRFTRICDTFNITGVSKDAIYLRLFPFSFAGRASTWLDTLPDNSITTWEDLQAKFYKKYYPPSRAVRLRDQIHSFWMDPDEPYRMAWERFNMLLSRCPQHGLSDWTLVEKFYNGLTFEKQQMFNTAVGGHIMERLEPNECQEMFESFAQAEQQHPHSVRNSIPIARAPTSSPRGVHQVTPKTSVAAALALMANEIKELKLSAQRCQEVKKVDWRALFFEIDARILEESESKAVSTRSHRVEEKETPPVVEEEEPVDEEIEMEKPAERAVEKKKGVEMKSPGVDLSRIPYPARVLPYKNTREYEARGISEVSLTEQCSAMVQNKLPEKMADSGRFTIPCLFGGLHLNHALDDLGASINLMPYSVYKQLDLGELQPTHMSISLADRSVKYPREIAENLLVKVGKFVFPVDFVILDMEVDEKFPLILGRPFLWTAKAMIDVFGGKLTLRVGDESITFDAMKPVEDVGEHSHSVCMLDAFIGDHRDYDLKREIDEPAPNLGEISEWALEMERLLDEPDEYGEEVPDDLLEIIAEFDEIIGKTPSVGKLEESVEYPDDPREGLEVTLLEIPVPKPLSILVIHSEGRDAEPNPSSSVPRSRPPRKRTRALRDSSRVRVVKTPSEGGLRVISYLVI
ncbi:hypothetical protein L1987_47981 [Smallanthus sonchifolius]|uniref:Uncharacterized protein n=1 Tax=Smallanthus sonchifolius TaxID=185202 RepID=A0ACB9FQQ9_9ASTR|nr:hypothetical protein L1987_47981 [Smallanthus sonchifolius]